MRCDKCGGDHSKPVSFCQWCGSSFEKPEEPKNGTYIGKIQANNVVLAASWNRELSAEEIKQLRDNPYEMFEKAAPEKPLSWKPVIYFLLFILAVWIFLADLSGVP